MDIGIREIRESEHATLNDFLYAAVYVPKGSIKPSRQIIKLPEVQKYINDFGKKHNYCLVAEFENKLVGAIWVRMFPADNPGFGFVNTETPELVFSVLKQYRNRGIGKKLLATMISNLATLGYQQVSVSVNHANYAVKMYQDYGFTITNTDGKSYILIRCLSDNA